MLFAIIRLQVHALLFRYVFFPFGFGLRKAKLSLFEKNPGFEFFRGVGSTYLKLYPNNVPTYPQKCHLTADINVPTYPENCKQQKTCKRIVEGGT